MNLVVIPTHVVNEEKKAMKGGERCSFLLDAFTRGGGRGAGGEDLLHFSPVLPPLMAPPPNFARFLDTRISSINGDQERRKLSCGDQ